MAKSSCGLAVSAVTTILPIPMVYFALGSFLMSWVVVRVFAYSSGSWVLFDSEDFKNTKVAAELTNDSDFE